MMSRLRKRLTYANVIASLALFLAMGGTGYALSLPKNSVGTKQIKRSAVTSKKIKNGSLVSKDFKAGQLPAGPQGPAGARGPAGPQGAPGSAVAYADVASGGGIFEPAAKNLTNANIHHTAGSGVYCFQDLPFQRRSVMAASAGFFPGELDTVVNVSVGYAGPDCPGSFVKETTRILTWDPSVGPSGAAADRSFIIWFED
jgi:hypothetical protein